jgi:hypothetical protein
MAAHNYDGDMLTDEVAQVHRSPGFITSNLIGKNDDGSIIKGLLVVNNFFCNMIKIPPPRLSYIQTLLFLIIKSSRRLMAPSQIYGQPIKQERRPA